MSWDKLALDLLTVLALPEGDYINGEYVGSVQRWKNLTEEQRKERRDAAYETALRKMKQIYE